MIDAGTFFIWVPGGNPAYQVLPPTPSSEALLRQYDVQIDLLKFYLELVAKVEAFYFALAGTVASFVLLHDDVSQLRAALWLPIVLGVSIAAIEVRALPWVRIMNAELQRAARGLKLVTWPEARVLRHALWGAAIGNLVVVGGLIWLFLHVPLKPRPASLAVSAVTRTATPSVVAPVLVIATETRTPTQPNPPILRQTVAINRTSQPSIGLSNAVAFSALLVSLAALGISLWKDRQRLCVTLDQTILPISDTYPEEPLERSPGYAIWVTVTNMGRRPMFISAIGLMYEGEGASFEQVTPGRHATLLTESQPFVSSIPDLQPERRLVRVFARDSGGKIWSARKRDLERIRRQRDQDDFKR